MFANSAIVVFGALRVKILLFSPIKTFLWMLFCLFDLMLYVNGKQLRSCWDGRLFNHTVPGQASWRQFTSIKCSFLPSN